MPGSWSSWAVKQTKLRSSWIVAQLTVFLVFFCPPFNMIVFVWVLSSHKKSLLYLLGILWKSKHRTRLSVSYYTKYHPPCRIFGWARNKRQLQWVITIKIHQRNNVRESQLARQATADALDCATDEKGSIYGIHFLLHTPFKCSLREIP